MTTKKPETATAGPKLDRHTARCVSEIRDVLNEVEAGRAVLIRASSDISSGTDGLEHKIAVSVWHLPQKVSS